MRGFDKNIFSNIEAGSKNVDINFYKKVLSCIQ
jgi:hypothetical protein